MNYSAIIISLFTALCGLENMAAERQKIVNLWVSLALFLKMESIQWFLSFDWFISFFLSLFHYYEKNVSRKNTKKKWRVKKTQGCCDCYVYFFSLSLLLYISFIHLYKFNGTDLLTWSQTNIIFPMVDRVYIKDMKWREKIFHQWRWWALIVGLYNEILLLENFKEEIFPYLNVYKKEKWLIIEYIMKQLSNWRE